MVLKIINAYYGFVGGIDVGLETNKTGHSFISRLYRQGQGQVTARRL